MEKLQPELATTNYARTIKRILDAAATVPADMGIEQWPQSFAIERVEQNIDNNDTYVFYDSQDSAVGTVECWYSDEKIWGDDATLAMYIHRLAINPEFGGREYGEQIIDWLMQKARSENIQWLRLDVTIGNDKLRGYYEMMGFAHVRDVKWTGGTSSLYQLPIDGLVGGYEGYANYADFASEAAPSFGDGDA